MNDPVAVDLNDGNGGRQERPPVVLDLPVKLSHDILPIAAFAYRPAPAYKIIILPGSEQRFRIRGQIFHDSKRALMDAFRRGGMRRAINRRQGDPCGG